MYRQFCSLKGKILRSNTDSVLPTSIGIVTRTIFTSSPGSVEDATSEYFGIAPAVLSPDLHLLLSLHAFSRLVRVGLGPFPPPFSTLHLWTIFYLCRLFFFWIEEKIWEILYLADRFLNIVNIFETSRIDISARTQKHSRRCRFGSVFFQT